MDENLVSWGADDGQDVDEEVDDIHIQVERGEHVLFGRDGVLVVPAEHDLSVVHDVDGEQQSAERSVDERHGLAREEHADDTEYHEDDDCHKQNASHRREVDLGLERKHGESEDHDQREQRRPEHLRQNPSLDTHKPTKRAGGKVLRNCGQEMG